MTSRRAHRSAVGQTVSGIDRIVRNVPTGHSERGLKEGLLTKAREILPGGGH